MTKTAHAVLVHVFTFDQKELEHVCLHHNRALVMELVRKGLIAATQNYDAYWDDEVRLSLTSNGILEMNLFGKEKAP